jgi:EF hand
MVFIMGEIADFHGCKVQNCGTGTTNRNSMKMKQLTAVALAFGLPLVAAVAQDDAPPQGPPPDGANQGPPDGPPPQGPGPRGMHRRPPPIIVALDTNHDGIIDADEIANAPAALQALLEKSGKQELTIMDLMGPPPRRGGGMGQGQGPGGDQGPNAGPPQGPPPDGTNGVAGNGRRGPGRGMHRIPPVFAALDTNHDGVIDASEIANASAALKTLDKDGTGQLRVMELLGPPPGRGIGPGGGFGPGGGPDPQGGQGQGPDGPPPDGGPDGGQMPPPPSQDQQN